MIQFTLAMGPRSVQTNTRTAVNKKTGHAFHYRDKDMMAYLDLIKTLALPHAPFKPLAGPLRVDYLFVFSRPKGLYRVKDSDGLVYHVSRPDMDNVIKGTQDGLSQCGFWVNDWQICDGFVQKRFAEKNGFERIEVTIRELCTNLLELGL